MRAKLLSSAVGNGRAKFIVSCYWLAVRSHFICVLFHRVALQNSLASLSLKPPSTASTAKLNLDKSGSLSFKATAEKPIVKSVGADPPDQIKQVDPEMGRALIAATLHNISLRKATIGPGVLTLLLTVVRNTKTLRVLHVARCLANLSVHPKSKVALAKERKLIPLLTAVMRCGCEEAERVQHYW